MIIQNQAYFEALGDCFFYRDEAAEAVNYFDKSINIIRNKRINITVDSEKREHDSRNQEYYQVLITALIKSNQLKKTFHYIEESKARAFLDLLGIETKTQIAAKGNYDSLKESKKRTIISKIFDRFTQEKRQEISHHLTPDFASEKSVKTISMKRVQKSLNQDQTVVEYYVLPGYIIIWVITKSNENSVILKIDSNELRRLVEGFRNTLPYKGSIEGNCHQLYRLLIEPVIDLINTKEIIFIPHGILHYFPMQLCIDEDENFLLDKYVIKYFPSASVIPFLKKNTEADQRLLCICNPCFSVAEFDNLSFAKIEIEEISSIVQNIEVINDGINRDELVEKISKFNYLHFICHSLTNITSPMQSNLVIGDYPNESGKLRLFDILNLKLNADLVVLSACEAGIGERTDGDEVVCLARAFLHAGAASVIFSLWQVDDESTAFLMREFYKYLKENKTSEALRLAQLDTKKKYDHVFHWAPFIYTGLD